MKKIKSETLFILADGHVYVQKPTSMMGGWARAIMLRRFFGKPVHIAGNLAWRDLAKKNSVSTLVQFFDGSFFVSASKSQEK